MLEIVNDIDSGGIDLAFSCFTAILTPFTFDCTGHFRNVSFFGSSRNIFGPKIAYIFAGRACGWELLCATDTVRLENEIENADFITVCSATR